MKVCLVAMSPDYSRREKQHSLAPYVLKQYADVHLNRSDIELVVLDFSSGIAHNDIVSKILLQAPDIVGFSCYIWNYSDFVTVSELLKKQASHLLLLFGGPMCSIESKQLFKEHSFMDIVCHDVRNGENSFIDLLRALADKQSLLNVPGIAFKDEKGDVAVTPRSLEPVDRTFKVSPILMKNFPFDTKGSFVTLETSRGCPFDCGYCGWGDGRIEYFPMERVFEEIRVIYNNPNVKFVLFGDSNMAMNKKRLIQIVEHIQKQSMWKKIDTYMYIYVNTLDVELVKILSVLPNFLFSFGMQTANIESLKLISSSRPSPGRFIKKISEIRAEIPDFKFSLDLLLGLPQDTLEGFKKTLDFAFSLEPEKLIIVYPIFLLPSSRFYIEKDTLGIEYGKTHPQAIISTKQFPRQDIENGMRLAIWTLILTTYYPAIAKFFKHLCRNLGEGQRIALLEKWIEEIDPCYESFKDISFTSAASDAFKTIKSLQRDMLQKLSSAKMALQIYSVIESLHRSDDPVFQSTISKGLMIFKTYQEKALNPCGKEHLSIIADKLAGCCSETELNDVHSIFRL